MSTVSASSLIGLNKSAVSSEWDAPVAFKALLFLLFIVYIGPQFIVPALVPLHLAKISAGIAITAYCFSTLSQGRSISIMNSDVKLILGFVGLALALIPLSTWPGGSLNFFIDVFSKSVVLLFLVLNLLTTEKRCRQLIWALALFSAFNGILAMYRYLNGEFFAFNRVRGGFSGITDDPNDLALSLNLAIPFIIYLFESSRTSFQKVLLGSTLLVSLAGIVVTFSRGGFLGLLAVFIWLVWIRSKRTGPGVFVKGLLLVMLFFVMVPAGYSDRIASIGDSSKDYVGSREARWILMKEAVKIAVENPFGAGLKMHNVLMKNVSAAMTGVHSAFLEVLADLGFAGGILFAMIFWRLMRSMREIRASAIEPAALKSLAEAVEVSFVAFAVSGMFLPVAYHAGFYILAGMALAVKEIAKRALFVDNGTKI